MRGRGRGVGVGEGAVWKTAGWEKVTQNSCEHKQEQTHQIHSFISTHTQTHSACCCGIFPERCVSCRCVCAWLSPMRTTILRSITLTPTTMKSQRRTRQSVSVALCVCLCVYVCLCVISAGALGELLVAMMATWVRFEGASSVSLSPWDEGNWSPAQNNSESVTMTTNSMLNLVKKLRLKLGYFWHKSCFSSLMWKHLIAMFMSTLQDSPQLFSLFQKSREKLWKWILGFLHLHPEICFKFF